MATELGREQARACACAQVRMQELAIKLDFKLDESYTPNRMSVRAGTSPTELREIRALDLDEPTGWVVVPLQQPSST